MCLFVNTFSVKHFSGIIAPRILKFGANIGYDLLYCVCGAGILFSRFLSVCTSIHMSVYSSICYVLILPCGGICLLTISCSSIYLSNFLLLSNENFHPGFLSFFRSLGLQTL